jgi:hypothetical protein
LAAPKPAKVVPFYSGANKRGESPTPRHPVRNLVEGIAVEFEVRGYRIQRPIGEFD